MKTSRTGHFIKGILAATLIGFTRAASSTAGAPKSNFLSIKMKTTLLKSTMVILFILSLFSVNAFAATYGTVNLAQGKPVIAYTGTALGDPSTITSSTFGYWYSPPSSCSFMVDLGAIYNIGKIEVWPMQTFGFTISTSTDNLNYIARGGYDWPVNVGFPVSKAVDGAYSARYIKYDAYSNWYQYVGIQNISVYEWGSFPPLSGSYGSTNLALHKGVTAVYVSQPDPTPLVDGDPSTTWTSNYRWCAGDSGEPYPYCWSEGYVHLDLGQVYKVGKIVVKPTQVQGYQLLMSQDSYDNITSFAFISYPETFATTEFRNDEGTIYLNGAPVRYIGFYPFMTTPQASILYPIVNEIEVYGWTTNQLPVILSPQMAGGNFTFSIGTATNQSYTVQQNTNLATTNWSYYTNFTGNGSLIQIVAPLTNTTKRFFRVREP